MVDVLIDEMAHALLASPKYRSLDLPQNLATDLLARELINHPNPKDAVKEARKKLHHIVALYLGDPDYRKANLELDRAFASGDKAAIKEASTQVLASHISTRERLEILDEFYPRLFELTGRPETILDLACGLNPLTFPWMGLTESIRYYAFDIHQPRVQFINHFFELAGLPRLATWQDVLVEPPVIAADVAFFFKEAHRFEQRRRGSNRAFWQSLPVRYLLVSLPPTSMSGQHDLADQQRRLVYKTVEGLDWQVTELTFKNELVFIVQKDNA